MPVVLVADADPFRLGLLDEACRGAGFEVMTALDGTQVLDMIARQPPAVVLMHVGLRDVPCEEVVEVLRADETLARLPILVVGECRGVDGNIGEPLRVAEIQDAVRVALRSARDRRRRLRESLLPSSPSGDPAIGAGTRSQLLLTLDYELTHAARFGQPLSCLYIRVPGDGQTVVATLRTSLRTVDPVFWLGADALLVLLPDTGIDGVKVACERVQAALEKHSAQVGSATGPVPDGSTADRLIAAARQRLRPR